MRFKVNKENIEIIETDVVNKGEYNLTKCEFEFSEEYTNDLVKVAIFTNSVGSYRMLIDANNECDIPYEITNVEEHYLLGVYAYRLLEDGETLDLRYSPKGVYLEVIEGSFRDANGSETPTDIIAQLTNRINEVANDLSTLSDLVDGINGRVTTNTENISNLDTNKVDKVQGYSLISDVEIERLANVDNYDDTEVKGDISDLETLTTNQGTEISNIKSTYSLITETGSQIALNINSTDYKMTAILKDKNGNTIYTSNVIDLPLESVVVNGTYDNLTKQIILTLENGSQIKFSVADLVSGLVSETQLNTILESYYTKSEINNLLNNKVDKVTGKGLSTNDYTNEEKAKLNGIETGAEVNIIEDIKVNGTSQTITNKSVDITIPDVSNFITKDVNDLTNYELKTNTGTNINLSINSSTYVITLQLKNSSGTVLSTGTVDLPLETMVVNASYDNITKEIVLTLQSGSTVRFSIADLVSGLQNEITSSNKLSSDLVDDTNNTNKFVTSSEKTTWNNKQDGLTAGNNININNNVISATDTIYDDTEIKADISDIEDILGSSPTVSSESSNITLKNTLKAKLKSLEVEGKSEQDSNTGKNLAKILDGSYTIGTVPYTIENSIIKINGTTSGTSSTNYSTFQTNSGDAVFWIEATGYTDKTSDNAYIILQVSDDGTTFSTLKEITIRSTYPHQYAVTLDNTKYYRIRFYTAGNTFTNATIKVMLEYGTSKTDYEPYVGGIASPNPDYPQEVKSVSGIENLFDESQLLEATDWVKNEDGYYTGTFSSLNTKFGSNTTGFKFLNTFKEKTAYTISFNAYVSTSTVYIRFYYTDDTFATISVNATATKKYTLTTDNSKTISRITGSYSTGGENILYIKDIQLVEGTQEKTNVPYGHWLPVKMSNKNIFNGLWELGTINNTTGNNTSSTQCMRSVNYIKVQPNTTYTVSTENNCSIYVHFYTNEKSYINYDSVQNTPKTFTTPNNCSFIRLRTRDAENITTITLKTQLEKSDTATPYTQHQEETTLIDMNKYDEEGNIVGCYELCSVDDIKDLLDIKDGKAVISKYMLRYVFTGSENITSATALTDVIRARCINIFPTKDSYPKTIFTHFKFAVDYSGNYQHSYVSTDGGVYLFIPKDIATTIDETKTWLKQQYDNGTPVEVYCETNITETIELKGTYNLKTYEEVTHIEILDDLEPNINTTAYTNTLQGKVQYLYDEKEGE